MTNSEREKTIQKHISVLGITREEAVQLIADDEAIDRMTKTSDIEGDLTEEQRKSAKKARQADRKKTTVYKFDTTKREKKVNNAKKNLIEVLRTAVEENGATGIDVTNDEREFIFFKEGVKYKVTMSCPRSQKGEKMRDINRIDPTMDEIERIWKELPDFRFFQLIDYIKTVINSRTGRNNDLFYLEDDKTLEYLKTIGRKTD